MDFFATENGEKSDSVNHIPNVLYKRGSRSAHLGRPPHPAPERFTTSKLYFLLFLFFVFAGCEHKEEEERFRDVAQRPCLKERLESRNRNNPKSGLASQNHIAKLSGPVLGCIKADFALSQYGVK